MTSEKETIEQFNQCLDELLEHKTFDPDGHHENMAILRLGESLRAMDFSSESKTRHRLRQKLLNELVLQQSPQNGTRSLPRLSITWLVAVFVLIVAVSILMSIQSNDSPSYSSLIGQPQNTPTTEPVLLTITPMVADTNATVMAMPSVTPASTSRTSTMRLEDVVTTFHISHFPLGDYQVVVIATQDIPANTVLEAEMLTEALIPTEIAPPWGYSSVELLVGLTVATNISQWSPIASEIRQHLLIDPSHVAITVPANARIVDELKNLTEGERFGIVGTFRFVDIDDVFQEPVEFATQLPPASAFDGEVQVVTEEFISDAVVVWSSYQRDFRGCLTSSTAVDAGIGADIPINSPARYPCLITISMSAQDAVAYTWALESEIPMTVRAAESDE